MLTAPKKFATIAFEPTAVTATERAYTCLDLLVAAACYKRIVEAVASLHGHDRNVERVVARVS